MYVIIEQQKNKAGYTATSCGRVGRGGNARFPTFRLVLTDRRTDGWTDKASYRVACSQLKRIYSSLMATINFIWNCGNGHESSASYILTQVALVGLVYCANEAISMTICAIFKPTNQMTVVKISTWWFWYLIVNVSNSSINLFIYLFASANFREAFVGFWRDVFVRVRVPASSCISAIRGVLNTNSDEMQCDAVWSRENAVLLPISFVYQWQLARLFGRSVSIILSGLVLNFAIKECFVMR